MRPESGRVAIGRISGFSYPPSPVYVPTAETEWVALHASHTEIAPDCSYVESDRDWTGVHTSYDDVYIPSECEEDEEQAPDFKAMLATVYAAEPSHHSGVGPGTILGGQAMAGGLGAAVTFASTTGKGERVVVPVESALEDGRGHGGGQQPHREQPPEDEELPG